MKKLFSLFIIFFISCVFSCKDDPQNISGFEIVNKKIEGTILKYTIHTDINDESKIILYNDSIYNLTHKKYSHIYIDYFNDKNIAKDYFNKMLDTKIDEVEKDELLKHYTYSCIINNMTNFKELKNNSTNKVMKLY
jgi:hypothetical protein